MSMSKFSELLKGAVTVRAEGFFTERFINLCAAENILLWGIKKESENVIFANIYAKDFKKIKSAAKKTKSKVKIIKKTGAPFAAHRYKKRRLAVFGAVLLIFGVYFYSTHLMGIDISGNEATETEEIFAVLKEFGIYKGARLDSIDRKKVQNSIMTRLDTVAWIGINIKGSRAYVEIKERIEKEEAPDLSLPCDLIASSSGIIDELDVRAGQTMVKKREFVEKGDLLVSGAEDSVQTGIRYVHSYGEIYALTSKNISREYKKIFEEKSFTGKKRTKIGIKSKKSGTAIFSPSAPKFEHYETKTESFDIGGLCVEKTTYCEQSIKHTEKSEAEILEFGKKELCEEFEKGLKDGTEIKNFFAEIKEKSPETLVVTVNFELRENICEERIIDKIENLNYDIRAEDFYAEANQ